MRDRVYTAVGHPNIAFVKYWGIRDGKAENLPNNSSMGMTLGGDRNPIFTITSICFSSRFAHDTFYVDGIQAEHPKGAQAILAKFREITNEKTAALVELGVSSENLDRAHKIANDNGAYGSKLEGGGGGGELIVNCSPDREEAITAAMRIEGFAVEKIEIADMGVKAQIESALRR